MLKTTTTRILPTNVPGIVTAPTRRYPLPSGTVTIGRDEGNSVVLKHPQVSRFHAAVHREAHGGAVPRFGICAITDLHSSNGTFVNDEALTDSRALAPGDMIRISDYVFVFSVAGDDAFIELFSEEGNARLDAIALRRRVAPGQLILRDVSLSIRPREFVAIVGTSGAGKSTLVNALSGFRPADSGLVLLNGVDFYKNLDALRETLGFVPQDDIIHTELTVYQALYYAACLRLPEDMRRSELKERIEQVLGDLQLRERRHLPIARLSGGQRKRVSIGVELLTRPRLFFLDEPTSGLDPGLESDMMHTFRALADQGHTLLLITHATTNIPLCDQVLFLARGGVLAYFGPPAGALRHFGAKDFPDIYARIESAAPEEWEQRYRATPEYAEMVQGRLREIPTSLLPEGAPQVGDDGEAVVFRAGRPSYVAGGRNGRRRGRVGEGLERMRRWIREEALRRPGGRVSTLRQFFILARRYAEITLRDRRNLALLLLQAPIISALLAAVFEPDIFDLVYGNYLHAKTLLFLMVCCSIWFGTSNAAREICKEAAIYRRERSANLKIPSYVFSKVAILCVLCAVQSVIMLAVISMRIRLPDLGGVMLAKMLLVLTLASVSGLAMGLLLSAIVTNPDKAGSLVPIVLIPQLVLAGALIPLQGAARDLGYLMMSRWSFEMLGQATRLEELPFVTPPGGLETPPEYAYQISFAGHFWIVVALVGLLLAVTCLVMRAKDRVE